MKNSNRKAYLFLLPSLLGTFLFVLFPLGDVVRRSFSNSMANQFVGLANYNTIFHNQAFLRASVNTVKFIAICIPLLLAVSFFLALLLHYISTGRGGRNRLGELFKTGFLVPMAVPVASVVFLWQLLFHDQGLLNRIILMCGGEAVSFLHSGKVFWVLVFTYIWKNIGYDMVLWLSGLSAIPDSLYEAAKVDGAGAFQSFRYVTLPSVAPVFYLTAVLSIVNSFKVFREAYLISGSYPPDSIYMLQHLFNNWFVDLEVQKLYAAAVIMALAVTVLMFFINRKIQKGDRQE